MLLLICIKLAMIILNYQINILFNLLVVVIRSDGADINDIIIPIYTTNETDDDYIKLAKYHNI